MFEAIFECWVGQKYTLTAASGLTSSQRGRINRAVIELKRIDATPDDVRDRWKALREMWPKVTITPQTLCSHWATTSVQVSTVDSWLEKNRGRVRGSDG